MQFGFGKLLIARRFKKFLSLQHRSIPRMELSKVSGDYERWIAAGKKPLSEK